MYTDGSNALKTEYYTLDAPGKSKTGKSDKTARAKRISAKKARALKKRMISGSLVLFTMAFVVLLRYATITAEYNALTQSREKLELVNAKVIEKRVKAEGNMDPKKIETEAERLGLRPPVKSQIKYISLGNSDNGEVLKTEETSAFSAFINRMSVILEYLY